MVQYNLPKSEKRREPEGPQVAGLVSGAAETAPKLAKYLAEWLLKRNVDPREIYKQTGYIQDTTTGELIYSFGDQGMKVRTDNPLLAPPEKPEKLASGFTSIPNAAKVYEQPGIPMKEEPQPFGRQGGYQTQSGEQRFRYGNPQEAQKPGGIMFGGDVDKPPGSLPTSEFGLPSDVKDPNQLAFWDLPSDRWGDPIGDDFLMGDPDAWTRTRSNVSREPTFEELFTHPLQEQYTPELGGIPITARYTDSAGNYSGRYFGGDNPGDVSKASATAEGQVGGVDVMNSMPSVALHEVGAHGGQNLFGWHRGGSKSESWMEDRGKELRRQAAQAQTDLMNQKGAVIQRLMGEHGLDRSQYEEAIDMYDQLFPGYYDRMDQYKDAESSAAVSPDYTAYQHEGGEAAGRNFQTRAAKLTSDIPMTGGPRQRQIANEASDDWYTLQGQDTSSQPREGDVHPLETYDVAPDLMRQRVVTKSEAPFTTKEMRASGKNDPKTVDLTNYMAESQPLKSQFDWLLSKAPAPAAAGAVGGAALASGSPASASEGPGGTFSTPKTDRLPASAQSRIDLAMRMAQENTAQRGWDRYVENYKPPLPEPLDNYQQLPPRELRDQAITNTPTPGFRENTSRLISGDLTTGRGGNALDRRIGSLISGSGVPGEDNYAHSGFGAIDLDPSLTGLFPVAADYNQYMPSDQESLMEYWQRLRNGGR